MLMPFSQAFDLCERVNGKGSTVILAHANIKGLELAEVNIGQHQITISIDGKIVGISRKAE